MRLTYKILAAIVLTITALGGVAFAGQSSASLNIALPQTAHAAPRSIPAGFNWESVQNQAAVAQRAADEAKARQDAIDALNAAQAQALADQLQAAADRLKVAAPQPVAQVQTPVQQVASSTGPGPCSAPNLPLSWIAWCESGCNPTNHNPSSSAAGKYQWLQSSWGGYGGYPTADLAPESVQDQKSAEAYAISGTGPWEASRGCWGGKF